MGFFEFFERTFLKRIDGKTAIDWVEVGTEEKDIAKKRECFENAVRLKPKFVRGWILLGNVHAEIEEYEKALEYYNRALAICPL